MPRFLSQQTLKGAVNRLAASEAASSLADYLVFKRALKRLGDEAQQDGAAPDAPPHVVTGMRAKAFVGAINELTARLPFQGDEVITNVDNPYYVPFGADRDATRGYRTKKFPSNGSSDTVSRWQSRSLRPLALVPDTSPKAYRLERRSAQELESFFLREGAGNSSGQRPRLLDLAIWWFRFTDLEGHFQTEVMTETLINAVIADFALNEEEIAGIFSTANADVVADDAGDAGIDDALEVDDDDAEEEGEA